jgi:ribosomal protein S12 methylthiotransferase accessory factor
MVRLSWKPHLLPVVIPGDGLLLLHENGQYLLPGATYAAIGEHLDGHRSADQIHRLAVESGMSSTSLWFALGHLNVLGLTREGDSAAGDPCGPEAAFWACAGADRAVAVRPTAEWPSVSVETLDGTGADRAVRSLRAACILTTGDIAGSSLRVVIADDYLDTRLASINRAALESGRPWMLARLAGTVVWLGPLFVPGRTSCWDCLAQRLRLNRQTERFVEALRGPAARAPLPSRRASLSLAADLLAVEVARWLATGRHDALEGGLLTFDIKTNGLARHASMRRPQCPACGTRHFHRRPGCAVEAEPVALSPSSKGPAGRRESADATFERLKHHVSPLTGVVRGLTESEEYGYLHVAAPQAFPMHRYDFRVLRDNLLGRSGGKGFDAAQARVSALCEGLERYSGIWQGEEEPVLAASRRRLGSQAIEPSQLFGFSERQYRERESRNAANDEPHAWLPRPLDDELEIDWAPCWSLTHATTRYVPACYAYYGHDDLRHGFCSSDSNGCAAGSTLTDAIAHGLLELIERDAVAIWWFNQIARPEIDLDRFALPFLQQVRDLYRDQDRTFWALDLTTDLGVPVVAAISVRPQHSPEDIIYGFGSDFSPAAAIAKAVLEMNQSLFAMFRAAPGGSTGYRTDRPAVLRWLRSATTANLPYLAPDAGCPKIGPPSFAWPLFDDWRDDLAHAVEVLGQAGHEVVVLNQTRADIGLPVSRVMAPGLCHFWRRLGTPRLYEVPVRMGWQKTPRLEADLNPWFIYF